MDLRGFKPLFPLLCGTAEAVPLTKMPYNKTNTALTPSNGDNLPL